MALINRDALRAKLTKLIVGADENHDALLSVREAMKLIDLEPTVDAVEVVRCRDCRYWHHKVDAHTHWVCSHHSFDKRLMHTTPDFFCADGKRRENDADG